jgi:hypothetical protein
MLIETIKQINQQPGRGDMLIEPIKQINQQPGRGDMLIETELIMS